MGSFSILRQVHKLDCTDCRLLAHAAFPAIRIGRIQPVEYRPIPEIQSRNVLVGKFR